MARKPSAQKGIMRKATQHKKGPAGASSRQRSVKEASTAKRAGGQDSPDKTSQLAIKELLAKGKKQGFLTYDEINECCPMTCCHRSRSTRRS